MGRASGRFVQAASADAISPLLFLRILDLPNRENPANVSSAYFVDAEEIVSFFDEHGDPEAYVPAGIKYDRISNDNSNKVGSNRVRVDNVNRETCDLVRTVEPRGCRCQLFFALREDLGSPDAILFLAEGLIQAVSVSEYALEAELTAPLVLQMRTPQRLYWPRCQWVFGGEECGFPDKCYGFWERWWKRTSTTYSTIDESAAAAIDRVTQSIDYSNINPGGQADYYNGRMLARLVPKYSETYTLTVLTDDGVRVWVNGVLKIDKWLNQSATWTCTFSATAGVPVNVQIDHYEKDGSERLRVQWSSASQALELVGATPGTVLVPESLIGGYTFCGKSFEDCKARLNSARFGGFPHILKARNPREVWTKV
jgi:hypothetical protein